MSFKMNLYYVISTLENAGTDSYPWTEASNRTVQGTMKCLWKFHLWGQGVTLLTQLYYIISPKAEMGTESEGLWT